METFITKIYVKESRGGVRDLEIPLSATERQHLIITGKNGSGKTSLLEEFNKYLSQIENGQIYHFDKIRQQLLDDENKRKTLSETDYDEIITYDKSIKQKKDYFAAFGNTEINFSKSKIQLADIYEKGDFLLVNFGTKRAGAPVNIPKGISNIDFKPKYGLKDNASAHFLQFIVNLKADRLFAQDENDQQTAEQIDEWFERFESQLRDIIFNEPSLKLVFDRKTYNFSIQIDGQKPFGFNALSDGYSAFINIIAELLMRMEAHNAKAYDMEGVVLIDEIETHLHVELQKRVLPFLVAFFPKIQFIVTTHSPFVIQSIENATICDLETKIIAKDLTAYSYDALVESFFMTDKYSETVKEKIAEYEKLLAKQEKTIEDREHIKSLQDYFASAKFISKELRIKLNQIELQYL